MANTLNLFRGGAVGFIVWLGGWRGSMPSVFWNSESFTSAFHRNRERILQVIMCAPRTFERVKIKPSIRIFLNLECAATV